MKHVVFSVVCTILLKLSCIQFYNFVSDGTNKGTPTMYDIKHNTFHGEHAMAPGMASASVRATFMAVCSHAFHYRCIVGSLADACPVTGYHDR